ncbi:hypothetical protein LTR84_005257 [Exophiala bonariae]|uniref:NAD(P)-binding protein n=1 Tax=Exophiala bonariae TaxID=1690606 RepID=A0AAV9NTA7_9EURO|nr:hypothetical protein LTR84_005257 [Exophiala bonariae]
MATTLPSYTKTWHNDVYPSIHSSRPELAQKGKRVVITGGAGGIGAATAEAFAIAGASEVIILGRTQATLEKTKVTIEKKHPDAKITALVTDVSIPSSIAEAFETIAKGGPIDVFINNAAALADIGPISAADPLDFWSSFEVNVRGPLYAVQAVLKNISKNGVIINNSSAIAHVPPVAGHAGYAVGKLATVKLFEYLQQEHPDLAFFNLQPGIIESTGVATKAATQSGNSWPQQDTVELPGHFMVWLSSPEASFLKGRFVWANWDVEELRQKSKTFQENPALLTTGLLGWPQ